MWKFYCTEVKITLRQFCCKTVSLLKPTLLQPKCLESQDNLRGANTEQLIKDFDFQLVKLFLISKMVSRNDAKKITIMTQNEGLIL